MTCLEWFKMSERTDGQSGLLFELTIIAVLQGTRKWMDTKEYRHFPFYLWFTIFSHITVFVEALRSVKQILILKKYLLIPAYL